MRKVLISLGCALPLLLAALGIIAVVQDPSRLVGVGAVAVTITVSAILTRVWRDARAVRAFHKQHLSAGRDLLIVYSASPHWQTYIEENWLRRWNERAVALNRSEPGWSSRPEALLWRRFAGSSEHTPAAIVVPRNGRPRVIRFYHAFRDYKHGRSSALRAKEVELETALESAAEHRDQRAE